MMWNNSLVKLPDVFNEMVSLTTMDFRNNKISTLPPSIGEKKVVKYFHIAGNPICDAAYTFPENLKGTDLCKQQCATDCTEKWKKNGVCSDNDMGFYLQKLKRFPVDGEKAKRGGCNVENCEYDGGDCEL